MTNVWVVQASCGDYYCEWDHLLGVYSSEEQAEMARGVAVVAEYVFRAHADPKRRHKAWEEVSVSRFELNKLPPSFEVR